MGWRDDDDAGGGGGGNTNNDDKWMATRASSCHGPVAGPRPARFGGGAAADRGGAAGAELAAVEPGGRAGARQGAAGAAEGVAGLLGFVFLKFFRVFSLSGRLKPDVNQIIRPHAKRGE